MSEIIEFKLHKNAVNKKLYLEDFGAIYFDILGEIVSLSFQIRYILLIQFNIILFCLFFSPQCCLFLLNVIYTMTMFCIFNFNIFYKNSS